MFSVGDSAGESMILANVRGLNNKKMNKFEKCKTLTVWAIRRP